MEDSEDPIEPAMMESVRDAWFLCACGGKYSFSYARHSSGGRPRQVVVHTWEPCMDYTENSPGGYLETVRRKLGGTPIETTPPRPEPS
jgi:hypothetical protein